MKNEDLKEFYNKVATKGDHYTFDSLHERDLIVRLGLDWKDKTVLDLGCGCGDMVYRAIQEGAIAAAGLDYSEKSIEQAQRKRKSHPGSYLVSFITESIQCETPWVIKEAYDILIFQGVLEHLDDPFHTLKVWMDHALKPGGICIFTVPNWDNFRGYCLMPLKILCDIPVTMVDLHYFDQCEIVETIKQWDNYFVQEWETANYMSKSDIIADIGRRFKSKVFKERFYKSTGKPLLNQTINKFEKFIHGCNILQSAAFSGTIIGYRIYKEKED